jgi:hypothetical protein
MTLPGRAESTRKRQHRTALFASALLLLGQLLLALHQLEHLDPPSDLDPDLDHAQIQCELCAAGAIHGAPLPAAGLGIGRALAHAAPAPAAIHRAPLLRPYRCQIQRAPPAPLRSTV